MKKKALKMDQSENERKDFSLICLSIVEIMNSQHFALIVGGVGKPICQAEVDRDVFELVGLVHLSKVFTV